MTEVCSDILFKVTQELEFLGNKATEESHFK